MCICTPPIFQSPNIQASKHQLMFQTCNYAPPNTKTSQDPLPNQLAIKMSNSRTCLSGPIIYWSTLGLDIRLHKQIHIYKGIWTMLWSEMATFTHCLAIYCIFPPWFTQCIWISQLPLSHKPYEYIQTYWPSNKHYFTTKSNQMLYLQQYDGLVDAKDPPPSLRSINPIELDTKP